jgi:hypothetical protein
MRPQLAEHPRALAHPVAQEARHRQLGVQDRARHLAEERERGVVPITERFGMVFVIQNTQSRDSQAMQLKLDELTRVNKMMRNSLINLEECPKSMSSG